MVMRHQAQTRRAAGRLPHALTVPQTLPQRPEIPAHPMPPAPRSSPRAVGRKVQGGGVAAAAHARGVLGAVAPADAGQGRGADVDGGVAGRALPGAVGAVRRQRRRRQVAQVVVYKARQVGLAPAGGSEGGFRAGSARVPLFCLKIPVVSVVAASGCCMRSKSIRRRNAKGVN